MRLGRFSGEIFVVNGDEILTHNSAGELLQFCPSKPMKIGPFLRSMCVGLRLGFRLGMAVRTVSC
jgi:hypothetical protein